jgi:hypothetical protein
MTGYDIYIFILCFIVFSMFTVLFSYMIAMIVKMRLKMIEHGLADEELTTEQKKPRTSCIGSILSNVVALLVCVALLVAFGFSVYMHTTEGKAANGIPSLKVVKSASMSVKNEKNTYLVDNDLNDQIQTFDIVVTRHLPAEEDLKLYDVVVYREGDTNIIHRIVGIEEPNEKHPDCRHFLLQGDAVSIPDQFPVLYSQMQGIYQGERIPYVGSFILFMQSPAGWLCILLVAFAMIATPLLERKLKQAADKRLQSI